MLPFTRPIAKDRDSLTKAYITLNSVIPWSAQMIRRNTGIIRGATDEKPKAL